MFNLRRYLRADRIVREQHEARKEAEEKLRQAHDTFERRVKERTAQLETLNAGLQAEIAEHKRTQLALVEARRVAEETSLAKLQFLASMSYALRTPLNAVIGIADMLRETRLDEEQRRYVDLVHSSGEGLLAIIKDVLEMSRMDAGKLQLDVCDFRLDELVQDTAGMFAARAHEKRIELLISIDSDVPQIVRGDAQHVRQILSNLLANAVKFTAAGSIEVRVERDAERVDAANDREVRFTVRDTGIGISPEIQVRLFEPFVQVDGSTTREHGGTGPGLAMSKQLVTMMGGTIGAEREPGHGARFWFVVPFDSATQISEEIPMQYAMGAPLGSSSTRILVVEDNLVNQQVAVAMLTHLGCSVDVAADGRQAIEAQQRTAYDLIFMDCQMPLMDGFAATCAIRDNELRSGAGENGSARVPIVAMTANALRDDRERCLTAGMDDYVAKPFRQQQLRAVLERWLPNFGAAGEVAASR
jgi:signal transduction histidine kinase/AmiR/NasT family two-component response regulator